MENLTSKFWIAALSVGGIGTVGVYAFLNLYREWLKLHIFVALSATQTFILMIIFLVLVFLALVCCVYAYMKKPTAGNSSGQAIDLDARWTGVNELDCNNLIGPDVLSAVRAMGITASCWLNGTVDKKTIIDNHFDDYKSLFDVLNSCTKPVPGYKGKKCGEFLTGQMRKAYIEMVKFKNKE